MMSKSVKTLTAGLSSGAFFAASGSDSPVRKDKAFAIVCAEEGLSPYSIAKACRVFRGNGEIAREYLSFPTDNENMKEARRFWLMDEIMRVGDRSSV